MYMYLYIFEDGTIKKQSFIEKDDLTNADDGILDIIDISNPKNPVQYCDGDWYDIDEC